MAAAPLVSVLVPVRNGRDDLVELLRLLEAQTLPRERFEVIIGDDGSTDGCTNGLESADGHVRVRAGPPINPYAALNRAEAFAQGEVLAICDADSKPEASWLERGMAALDTSDLVGGSIRFIVPGRRTMWTLLSLDMLFDQERAMQGGTGLTGNLFVRRELFRRVGGFDDSLPSHGDYEFVSRCVAEGARTVFSSEAAVWHPTRDSARAFLSRIWTANYSYAVREARAGRRPLGTTLRFWIPVLRVARARRRVGFQLRLDRTRLALCGVHPTIPDDLRALPAIYVVIPGVAGFAQLRGWWHGRRRIARSDHRCLR